MKDATRTPAEIIDIIAARAKQWNICQKSKENKEALARLQAGDLDAAYTLWNYYFKRYRSNRFEECKILKDLAQELMDSK